MRNYFKKVIACQLTVMMALSAETSVSFAKKKATIKLNKTNITLNKGKTYSLKLTGTSKKAFASSSNKKIAVVKAVKNKNQWKIKGLKSGTAKIIVKLSKKKYTCKITVTDIAKDKASAKKVSRLINKLPTINKLTLKDKSKLDVANKEYNSLTKQQKKYVSKSQKNKLTKLLKKMSSLKNKQETKNQTTGQKTANKKDDAQKNNQETKNQTTDQKTENKKDDAQKNNQETKNQTTDQKTENKKDDAQKSADQAAAKNVSDQIATLPNTNDLTAADEAGLNAAKAAYDQLSASAKTYVNSGLVNKLNALLNLLPSVKQKEADELSAKNVSDQIATLPNTNDLTAADEAGLNAAKDAYDQLSASAKTYVNSGLVNKLNALLDLLPSVKQKEALSSNVKKVEDAAKSAPLSMNDGGFIYEIAFINGSLEFRVRRESIKNGYVALGDYFFMTYSYPTDTVDLSMYQMSDIFLSSYSAKSSLNVANVTIVPNTTWTIRNSSNNSLSSIENNSDSYLILGLNNWNKLLKDKLNLSLSSIGFTNYNA